MENESSQKKRNKLILKYQIFKIAYFHIVNLFRYFSKKIKEKYRKII